MGLLPEQATGAGLLLGCMGVTAGQSPWLAQGTRGWVGYLEGAGAATLGPEVWKLQETRDMPLSRGKGPGRPATQSCNDPQNVSAKCTFPGSALTRPGGPLHAARSASVTVPRLDLGGKPVCPTPGHTPDRRLRRTVDRLAGAGWDRPLPPEPQPCLQGKRSGEENHTDLDPLG